MRSLSGIGAFSTRREAPSPPRLFLCSCGDSPGRGEEPGSRPCFFCFFKLQWIFAYASFPGEISVLDREIVVEQRKIRGLSSQHAEKIECVGASGWIEGNRGKKVRREQSLARVGEFSDRESVIVH